MSDPKTIAVYDDQVDAYAKLVVNDTPHHTLVVFIERLGPDSLVLNLGCGPGNASATMVARGLRVDPIDASNEMVRLANKTYKVNARQATFDDITATQIYDGIWANFSLLHAAPDKLPTYLERLHQALVPGGIFHIAMKLGADSERDKLGRFYAYYSQDQLVGHLEGVGFFILATQTGEDPGLAGDIEPWIAITTRCDKRN